MRDRESMPVTGTREDRWLEEYLQGAAETVHAPRGFARKVMDAVYRESLAGRAQAVRPASRGHIPAGAVRASQPTVARMYRRLGLSFMFTAAVLAASLLVPHGAYPTLIGGSDSALGAGPSNVVQRALLGAGHAVQGALGEQLIGGKQE